MYFPTLNTLKNFQIDGIKVDDFFIKKLDIWLGTRRKAIRKFLSPTGFSIDTGIDEDVSIDLFILSTEDKVNILKQRFVVECPLCNSILGSYDFPNQIPHTIFCAECNKNILVNEDMIVIWFELIQHPQLPKNPTPKIGGTSSGKGDGLRAASLKNSKSSTARRFSMPLNERFRGN